MASLEKIITTLPKTLFSKDSWKTLGEYMGLGKGGGKNPVNDHGSLVFFLKSRASHVAQTSLYGYLKTRAGTRFPEMFEDPGLLLSMNMAKWQIWLACLSDLSIYAGTLLQHCSGAKNEVIAGIIADAVNTILTETGIPEDASNDFEDTAEAIRRRVNNTDYASMEDGEMAFRESPDALYHWAPIADELKKRDKTIVRNSVRFRWKEIRQHLRDQLQTDELLAATVDLRSI